MTQKDIFLGWLNDAYSMETGIVQVLEEQVKAAADYPEVKTKIQDHLEKTRGHAEKVKQAIDRAGGDISILKEGAATVMGWAQGATSRIPQDSIVKNSITDLATENFEIASYNSLLSVAEELGDQQTIDDLRSILADDEEMADWLSANLGSLTQEFIRRENL